MSEKDEERLVLSVSEASRLLGLSRGLAYEAIRTGQIPSIRIGRRILVPRRALERLLDGGVPGSRENDGVDAKHELNGMPPSPASRIERKK